MLLISEQAQVVSRIGELLSGPGYRFTAVPAKELAAAAAPHIILLDVETSPGEGERILGRLRALEATRDVPVVLLTGEDDVERWLAYFAEGLVDYLSRPFSRSELAARIALVRRTKAMFDETRQRNRRLKELSITDSLTGLYYGWYVQHRCREEVARAKRHQYPIACLMLDVDNFKRVNDGYGHPAGNAVLAQLGRLLKASTRASDIAGRYGGEEFLLILPQTGRGEALTLAERLRRTVADHAFKVGGAVLNVTVSVGVAAFPDVSVIGHETLVRQADRAMYQAKLDGRNRVVAG